MAWIRVSVLVSLLFIAVSGRRSCWGYYNQTTLHCHDVVLEADKPLQIDRKIYRPNTGICNDTVCLNHVFSEFAISGSSGSIGTKTFSLMPEIEYLSIHGSKIYRIEDGAICSLPNLKNFTLVDNLVLPNLTESVFRNCDKLKFFRCLSCKQLESNVLQQMSGLDSLWISSQNFPRFAKDYLKPLTMLKGFKLEHASIGDIEEGAFCVPPNLELLILIWSENLPTLTKSAFSNCTNVRDFELRYNENLNIDEHAFDNFVNVESVYLDQLKIGHLKKGFVSGFKNAQSFEIFHSDVSKIDGDCFSNFSKLTKLFLSGLNLTQVDPEMLNHLPKLVKLNLGYNRLTSIENVTHPTLEYLWVYENRITDINPETLKKNLPNLKELHISGNPIPPEKKQVLHDKLSPSIKINGH